ncbi:heparinase II/III family protein [Candidatus Latescibacterota bacterium]
MDLLDDEARVDEVGFFAQLSPALAELQPIRDAAARGDWEAARQALVRHFLERTDPCWTFDWRDPTRRLSRFVDRSHTWGTAQLASLRERTDALLADQFVDGAGTHHDISDLGTFLATGLRYGEQAQYITMFIWAMDLGEMHARTRDSVYAHKFCDLFIAYDDSFPRVVTNRDPDHSWLDETIPPTWHEMFVGKAAVHLLSTLYTGLLHDPCVEVDVAYRLIRKLWFHAAQFTRFTQIRSYRHHNHHWYERGTCAFVLGLMLPEFDGFARMCERGRQVINDHLERDFLGDGTYREHSTSYQSSTLAVDLLFPWTVAHANQVHLVDERNLAVVGSWLGWYASMTQPNGELPPIGDGFGPKSIGRLGRGAILTADPSLKGFVQSLSGCATADPDGSSRDNALGLEDSLLADWARLPAGRAGFASAVFEEGGWIALRDSWDRGAMYCAMSAISSPHGRNHGHWDLLHFTLFARGQSLLADPASWIYNGYYTAERRGYLYSMTSHNVLTIDDDPLISKRQLYSMWTGDVPSCRVEAKALHEMVDVVSGSHDAYAPQRHTRDIYLVKRRYLLVLDHVTSADPDWVHTYRRLLHFDFGVEVVAQNHGLAARCGDAALACVPVADGGVSLNSFRDGYLERERRNLGHRELPWVTEVKSEQAGSTVMAMLFYPHSAADSPRVSITRIPVSSEGQPLDPSVAVAYEIVTPRGRDTICRNYAAPEEIALAGVATTAPVWVELSGSEWSGPIDLQPC